MRWFTPLFPLLVLLLLGQPVGAATYSFQSDTYAWETASTAVVWEQSNTSYPRDDDKKVVNFSGGFTFTFGGVAYSAVRIHSNGALQFGADSAFHRVYTNTNLPISGHDRLILMYWDDINPNTGGTVTYQQKGTAPNRYFVVSWENVPHYSLGGVYSFQVILYENGDFKYQYGAGNAAGASATIGVEVSDSDYTLFSYNNAWGTSGTAIRWSQASATPNLSAFYAFEDANWTGAAQEVFDRSGNERHGTRIGTAQVTASGKVCQGASIPYNTTTASISAIQTAFDLDATLGSRGAVSFWYKSNAAWSGSGAHDAQLLDATTSNNRWFFLMKDNTGKLRLVLTDSAGTTVSVTSGTNSVAAGTWAHIAATWVLAAGSNQSVLRLYLNGALVVSANVTTNGNLSGDIGTLYLGDNRSSFVNATSATKGTAISADGILDEVRLYNYEISSAQVAVDMAESHSCDLDVRVGLFNAVDVGGDPVTGPITTKQAGLAFQLDVLALNPAGTALATGFSGDVLVDLIANTSTGVSLDGSNCPASGTTLAIGTLTMPGSRTTLTVPAVAEAWRDVRARVRYPASGSASITACSADNFALKPASLTVQASHADWQTAGSAASLNNGSASGGALHKAGRPFTLGATAYNAAGVVTSQYDGSPTASVTCSLPASGCVAGTLSAGIFSAASGTVTSSTASYSEVGALSVTLTDSDFASVDNDDTAASCAGFHLCASAITVGRFVPDHFDLAANTPAFAPGCGSFTYLGQPFGLATAPLWTVTARNLAGTTTANYTGSLMKLSAATVTGQAWSDAARTVAAVGSLPDVTVTDLGAGQASLQFGVGDAAAGGGLAYARTALIAPFTASLGLAASVADSEGVAYAGNPYSQTGIAFSGGNSEQRFGRLRLLNAAGSEYKTLTVPLSAQYWNGQGFASNGADSCTALAAPTLSFYADTADNKLASGETTPSYHSPLLAGAGGLSLSAPGAGNHGFLDLSFSAPAWLDWNWDGTDQGGDGNLYDDDPPARAAFGKRQGRDRVIIRREIY